MQQISAPASKKSLWWWAYFALAVAVYAASIFVQWHRVPGGHVVTFRWVKGDELLALVNGIGLLGLLGYLRGIAVWRRWFWVGYACLTYAGAAIGFGLTLLQAAHSDALFLLSLLLAGTAFAIPLWVALWRYAFRCPGVWREISTAA